MWVAILIAPLAAPIVYLFALWLFEWTRPSVWNQQTSMAMFKAIWTLFIVALPVSYGVFLLLGLPLIWLLNRINKLTFASCTLAAVPLGALVMMAIFGSWTWSDVYSSAFFFYPVMGGVLGFIVAALFCTLRGITPGMNR